MSLNAEGLVLRYSYVVSISLKPKILKSMIFPKKLDGLNKYFPHTAQECLVVLELPLVVHAVVHHS